MALSNTDLNFTVLFNLNDTPSNFDFTDTTNYAGASPVIADAQVDGLIRADSPSGVAFYANDGYASDDYTSPNIDGAVSMSDTDVGSLPLDADGEVEQGVYTFRYKVRVVKQFAIEASISTGRFTVTGTDIMSWLSIGDTFTVTGTASNDGTYTVTNFNISILLGTTQILVSESVIDGGAGGYVNDTNYYETSKTVTYCFETPIAELTVESNCYCSKLTATDDTDYTVNCNGSPISYTSIARTTTINYPDDATGTPVETAVTGSTIEVSTTENIWTGVFTATLSSVLTYTLATGFTVQATVIGYKNHTVECSTCMCTLVNCIKSVRDAWLGYLGTNLRLANEKGILLQKALTDWSIYRMYVTCGEYAKAEALCTAIQGYLNPTTGCCTDTDTNDTPTEVIPTCGSSTGSGSTTIVTSDDGSINVTPTVVGSTTTYDLAVDVANIQSIVTTLLSELEINISTGMVMDDITADNCFSITDGMSLTEAINLIIATICPLLDSHDPGDDDGREIIKKEDFEIDEILYMPTEPFVKDELVITDVSGVSAAVSIGANSYYSEGRNVTHILTGITLSNNQDNYIYLNHDAQLAYAVSAVTIGNPAPTTTGEKIAKVTTGTNTVASITQLMGYFPVTENQAGFNEVEILGAALNDRDTNGNYKFDMTAGGKLGLYKRESGSWVLKQDW